MSRKYKFHEKEGAYFISFATVYWIDLFTRMDVCKAGEKNSNVKNHQLWQQHNQPIQIWSLKVFEQKLNYIHQNPVESGFVTEPWEWKYSSARNYCDDFEGILKIDINR